MREGAKRGHTSQARTIMCCVPVARLASLRTTKELWWNPGMRLDVPVAFWSTAMTESTTNSFRLSVCALHGTRAHHIKRCYLRCESGSGVTTGAEGEVGLLDRLDVLRPLQSDFSGFESDFLDQRQVVGVPHLVRHCEINPSPRFVPLERTIAFILGFGAVAGKS